MCASVYTTVSRWLETQGPIVKVLEEFSLNLRLTTMITWLLELGLKTQVSWDQLTLYNMYKLFLLKKGYKWKEMSEMSIQTFNIENKDKDNGNKQEVQDI